MSKRSDVLAALHALVAAAVAPIGAEVVGLYGSEAPPARLPAGGRVIIASGEPGEPEVDLSPLAYHYDHRISLAALTPEAEEAALDVLILPIADAVEADPTLGGLCSWCEFEAPETDTVATERGQVIGRGAQFAVIASYSTTHPLR